MTERCDHWKASASMIFFSRFAKKKKEKTCRRINFEKKHKDWFSFSWSELEWKLYGLKILYELKCFTSDRYKREKRLISLEGWLHWKMKLLANPNSPFSKQNQLFRRCQKFFKSIKMIVKHFFLVVGIRRNFCNLCRREHRLKLPPISNRYFQPGKSCCYYFVIVSSALKSQINIIKIVSCLIPPLLQPLSDASYSLLLVLAISFLFDETFAEIAIGQSRLIDSFPNKPATGITLPEKPTSCGSK